MRKPKIRKSCSNCANLKTLHKIGRDCNTRIDPYPRRFLDHGVIVTGCNDWVYGKCRNNLKVKIAS